MKRLTLVTLVAASLFFCTLSVCSAQEETAVPATDTAATTPAEPAPAAPAEEAVAATPEPESPAVVSVVEARICEGISDREPVAPGDVFPGDISVLYCFSRIESAEPGEIRHIWYFQDTAVAEIPLNIGISSGWRTFSSKVINPIEKGNWKVDIVTAQGESLKTIQFVVN